MKVNIRDRKLKTACEDEKTCVRRFGSVMAKKIKLRLNSLSAAESLGDFWPPLSGPERCHELAGELKSKFSVDLKHPYRLIFEPDSELDLPPPDNAKLRWQSITIIEITGIEDTHG